MKKPEPIKVKNLDLIYEREYNLFQMKIKDIKKGTELVLAVKGTDWGISPDVSDKIIEDFCKEMKGKEKNLHIEIDKTSINKDSKNKEKEVEKAYDNLDQYPINELTNKIFSEKENKKEE